MKCEVSSVHFPTGMKAISLEIAVLIINIVIALFGTVANGLVIMSFYLNPRLRMIHNKILMLLAITDVCVTAIVQPIYVAAIANSLLGKHICLLWDMRVLLTKLFLGLSLITITILSFQTYITLVYPYQCKTIITKSRLNIVIASSWLIVVVFTGITFVDKAFIIFALRIILCITIVTVVTTWWWTYKLVARHRKAIQSTQAPSNSQNIKRKTVFRSSITALVVIFSLLVCYLLALCQFIFENFLNSSRLGHDTFHVFWSITVTLAYLNSLLNPCLLIWRSTAFRRTVRNIFKSEEKIKRNDSDELTV